MNDLRTAAQQALEALERYRQMMFAEAGCRWGDGDAAITALRAALAQAEPQGCATEEDCTKQPWCRIRGECQRKQAESDHETRAELAEQQVVQLAEERDHPGSSMRRGIWRCAKCTKKEKQ